MSDKPSLYLETTIPSYLAARTSNNIIIAGRQAITHEFWETERHNFNLYVSDVVYEECSAGDPVVAKRRLEYLNDIAILNSTPDVKLLAETYMQILSIPYRSRADAFHLAICCINEIDYLLSWNCTHLGVESMLTAQKYNDEHGYSTPIMVTPDGVVNKYTEVDFNA